MYNVYFIIIYMFLKEKVICIKVIKMFRNFNIQCGEKKLKKKIYKNFVIQNIF